MKALILAAGIGKRLNSKEPKILLKIGQKTLLERYYQNLVNIDVNKIGLVVGFQKEKIEGLIKEIDKENRITIFRNTEFTKGSVISLVKASNFFEHQEEMILMDGDVLYHHDILQRLVNSKKKNCFLLDRNIEEGEEPVKICIKKNHICCDNPKNSNYNKIFETKNLDLGERLWRKDILYNILIVIGYNDNPIIKDKGSAIFLHLSKKNITSTKGCIALEKKNMINLLKHYPKKIKIF